MATTTVNTKSVTGFGASAASKQNQEFLLKILILSLIYVLAFSTRLFSVLRYESVIHEFDPYFNFRSTKYLVAEGFYNFLNWFDERSWYPLGRIVGGTIYPGLMATAAAVHWVLNSLNLTVNIRNVCVLLSPWFASNTAMVTYKFAKEIKDTETGLVAAAMIAIVPGYISRSVAGSFDNEGIAIFALIFTYYCWVKSVNTGSLFWAAICSLAYFYMASAWGGYVFIINLIPLHVLALLLTGRYSHRLYVAYSTLFVIGTILSMQINFIGFQPVQSSEHMAAIGVFGLLQLFSGLNWVKSHLSTEAFARLQRLTIMTVFSVAFGVFVIGTITGYISPWTGRFYSLLDPTYARDNIPIIASVSEHQPTTWASYFFDLHILVFLFPAGLYFCFSKLTDANIFLILYGITSIYFSGVMVRLMLVLAPVACVLAAVAISSTLQTYTRKLKEPTPTGNANANDNSKESSYVMIGVITVLLVLYAFHCTWVTSEAYSSPSIVLSAKQNDGSRIIFDDFREAYRWIGQNTPDDARIMSWWDYGYQLSAMANRTVLVDNNTWNNSHIAQVGKAFASSEEDAYKLMKELDVDYVLVIFGGLTGYSSDDINKFLWMVRIGGSTDPSIKEADYLANGHYRIDKGASPKMLNTLMYKLCYYRFSEINTDYGKPSGYDRVRNVEIGYKNFQLTYLEEAFTSLHWLVRVYKVKDLENRA
ncbi:oligosaccharyl transferase [Heterostelium album PN500]|uniref:dolichyl-diphosphooligosaccharide--protein glycotransferase n=1 Tax=Heterostelium pallidum (strain ATCC 26659 / Pp 5 / PN500) TaxID=670386 RepID=D3BM68_HETP5|nr:oligosaccharyl transferase [Heterostelium album PN500]EFA77669.1 oligosaccharyl transferase [Heterostelium album PN500]|eukprot:XP_020429797.1 oligosaccharyl transferase [Heterostelium album PN500]